jgi:phosphoribosylformylglycinamidine (FGAM) synthase-like amidotransferase family enzyme
MSSGIVRVKEVAKNKVVMEYADGSKVVFELVQMPNGSKVLLMTLLDKDGSVIGGSAIPARHADQ